ncbi:hypothetical protein [Cohnella sp. JJ-181]|uniref:hypothetical protein n=1 Tax=Cohnella rhizoplanae TaxID=2974897 RepID=UPI0022FF673B|nr:hypothetical protein [Cohnella sp. JJ-181]CAI6082238.1 hypothetical protein COHCIP112018_03575 [Cohnella sp. JJ-181]
MIRYYYYHIFYVGMMNIMVLVPYVLISHRFDGAVSSFPLAIACGTLYSFVTSSVFQRFPGLGLPEIYKLFFPVWLANCLNIIGVVIWSSAGIIVLFSYSNTIGIFFDPEASSYLNLGIMAIASLWAATRSSRSVQFAHEVLLVVSSPIVLWILSKALFSDWLDWDAIRLVAGAGIRKPPSMACFFAASFVFSGHMNITLFNRLHPPDLKFRFRWMIPIVGTFFLLVSFFVPIGFHGTQAVGNYLYVWSVTTDSLMMKYGFIQRVLYLFLLLYTFLSLLFVMNTWHTGMEFLKACFKRYKPLTDEVNVPAVNWWICSFWVVVTFVYAYYTNDLLNRVVAEMWLITHFIVESILVFMLLAFWYMKKKGRMRRSEASLAPQGGGS